jgi:cbb3-type cytochrome oxidase maturation protein
MNTLFFLIPIALILGAIWLAIFMWTLKSGQYDDLDGAAWRALNDEERPLPPPDKDEKK